MAEPSTPSTYRAWQFTTASGGLEKNLKINSSVPMLKSPPDQHLVQVLAVAINPIDHKVVELPLFTRLAVKTPATPCVDFAGRIVKPANGSTLQPGQLVFGIAGSGIVGGALGEYATAMPSCVAKLPEGVSPIAAASVNICGETAYQSIIPFVKDGSSIFINGGSGGTGIFGIQVAKAVGCYVTTTCSTANVDLCKSLGADEVIDYKKSNILETLKASGRKYDHIVDNVGSNTELFWKAHEYSKPPATYVLIGAPMSFKFILESIAMRTLPRFLGGGQRKLFSMFAQARENELAEIGKWMQEGKVKPVIDSQFAFEDAPMAFEKLKTGRAKGKIVIEVASEKS